MSEPGSPPERPVALITGAGGGIGEALVTRFVADGYHVLAADARPVEGQPQPQVHRVCADVRDPKAMELAVEEAAALGGLRAVVANAGVLTEPLDGFFNATVAQWQTTLDVNLLGVLNTFRAGAYHLVCSLRGGRLLATASAAAIRPEPSLPAYCASKAAVVAVVQSLALELGHFGITVNAVAPGPTLTPGQAAVLRQRAAHYEPRHGELPAERFERHRNEGRPVGRLGMPEEVAAAMAWLASDEASYVTGHTLVVDGGAVLV